MANGLAGGAGTLGGLGLAGAVVGCCGGKLLLASGIAAGGLRYWPLLVLAGVLVAIGLWRRHRRQTTCPTATATAPAADASAPPSEDAAR
jgi:hypothetical protein